MRENNANAGKNNANAGKFACAFMIFGLWATAVYVKCGIYFETNDDRIITEILSGVLALKPEFHTAHVSVFLSAILSALYGITAAVPWYGICLILFHVLVYTALLSVLLSRAVCLWERAAALLISGCFALLNIGLLAQIQYTSTAALLAMAGYACILLAENGKYGLAVFIVFELSACLLRDQAMLMIQPLGMAVTVLCILTQRERTYRQKLGRIAPMCAAALAVLAVTWIGARAAYNSADWKRYQSANSAREELFDYGDKLSYEEAAPILDKYGVTRIQYEAFLNYTMLDGELSAECLQELAAFCRSARTERIGVGELFAEQIAFLRSDSFRGLNRAVLPLWAMLFFCVLISGQFSLLFPMGGLLAARVFVWGFLIGRGRLPQRILSPLFACEILLLLVLFVRCYLSGRQQAERQQAEGQQGRRRVERWFVMRAAAVCFLLLLAVRSVDSGRQQYRYAAQQNRGQETFFAGAQELQDYCSRHPERRYYVEALSQAYYVGSALETEFYGERDYLTTGCWYFNSPAMNARTEAFRSGREEGAYLIIYAYADVETHPAVLYFEEKFGAKPVEADRFTLSHGGSYVVFYFAEGY